MRRLVLGIGYGSEEYETVRLEWREYGIEIDFVDDLHKAIQRLSEGEYICVAVCSYYVPHDDINTLRSIRAIPVVVLPPQYSAAQRVECIQQGTAQYIRTADKRADADLSGKDNMRFTLDPTDQTRQPLTIIIVKDLYFCLEYRTVEVRGQEVELTRKEFEILRLLLTHPLHVYTFEMLFEQVWGDAYTVISKKTVINHMSSLRRKLKVEVDLPDYIINIHGVGYKYDLS